MKMIRVKSFEELVEDGLDEESARLYAGKVYEATKIEDGRLFDGDWQVDDAEDGGLIFLASEVEEIEESV